MHISPRQFLAANLAVALAAANQCASSDVPAFPADFRTTYTKMADCKKSSAHTEGAYVEPWISPNAVQAWQNRQTLPAGAVLVKVQHNDAACADTLKYTAMRKDGATWTWQQIGADRSVTNSGNISACSSCHTPCKATDWVCTAPK